MTWPSPACTGYTADRPGDWPVDARGGTESWSGTVPADGGLDPHAGRAGLARRPGSDQPDRRGGSGAMPVGGMATGLGGTAPGLGRPGRCPGSLGSARRPAGRGGRRGLAAPPPGGGAARPLMAGSEPPRHSRPGPLGPERARRPVSGRRAAGQPGPGRSGRGRAAAAQRAAGPPAELSASPRPARPARRPAPLPPAESRPGAAAGRAAHPGHRRADQADPGWASPRRARWGAGQYPWWPLVTGNPRPGAGRLLGHRRAMWTLPGPGRFYRLRLLHPGNKIYVRQAADGWPHSG